MWNFHRLVCVYVFVCCCVCICCMHVSVYVWVHMYMHVCICACIVSICVYTCMCVLYGVYTCMCVCTCVWMQRSSLSVISRNAIHLILRDSVLSLAWSSLWPRLAGEWDRKSFSHLPSTGITSAHHQPASFLWVQGPELRSPCLCSKPSP